MAARIGKAARLTQWVGGGSSNVSVGERGIHRVRAHKAAIRLSGERQASASKALKHVRQVFYFRQGEQIWPEKPYYLQAILHDGDFASEMKTRGAGRAHREPGGQPVKRYVWNRVVLQGEPNLKNGIMTRRRQVSERAVRVRQTAWRSQRNPRLLDAPHSRWSKKDGLASTWPRSGTIPAQ